MLIATVALLAAVAFSVSVESRSGRWLGITKPTTPAAKAEVAKNSTVHAAVKRVLEPPTPAVPFVPTVTASKTDALITDVDMDGKADPGDTLQYTVVIGASGEDATGVVFEDTLDPNTALVNGTIMSTPLARPDTYAASGNIRISINAASGVLTNDVDVDDQVNVVDPPLTVTAETKLSTNGGNVTINADGSFTFNPAPGFEGPDTFTYTLNDGEGPSDTGTVTINVTGMIWFINNNAGVAGDGRLTSPFNTLAAFEAVNGVAGVNNPAANDNIFVYESAIDYVGPVTLENGQKFIGQDATDSLENISGVNPPAGSDPLPATNSGNATLVTITSPSIGIQVAQNNTLRGFTGGNAGTDINGTSFGNLSISDVTLNGTGRTLALDTGTLTATIASLASASSSTTGITLIGVAGSLTSGSTTISSSSGNGIHVTTSSGNFSFAGTSVTGGAIGINLTSNTGPFTFAATTVTGSSGVGINMTSNTGNAGFGNTNVSSSGGTGVNLGSNSGTITFPDLDISPDANQKGLSATENSNTITTTSGTISTSGAAAIEVNRTTGTTPLAMVMTETDVTGGPNGIFLRNTTGSFSLVGDGTNTAQGGNATGGTISGMTGADGTTAGIGVYAENVQNLSLRRLTINGVNQGYGLRGLAVNNFILEYSTVNGTNGTAASLPAPNTAGEGSVYFGNLSTTGMTGTGTITNCIFGGGRHRNFSLINTSGTLDRLTILGTQFQLNQAFMGANGESFSVESRNNGTVLNTTVRSSTFAGAPGDLVEWIAQSGTTMDVVFGGVGTGNTMSNNHANNNIGGGGMTVASAGAMTFNISNNTMRDANGSAVTFQLAAPLAGSTEARSINGTFNANAIGVAGVVGSGSLTANGIFLSLADNQTAPKSQATIALTNNTIRRYNGNAAIFADNTGGNYDANLTITGNTADNPGPSIFAGMVVTAGALGSTDDIDVCANISGNNFATAGDGGVADIIVGVSTAASTLRLPGLATPATQAQIEAFVLGNNNVAGTTVFAFADAPATFAANFLGGAACTIPSAGPITASATETAELRSAPEDISDSPSEKTLWAARGENAVQQNVVALTPSELSAMTQAAITRLSQSGLSAKKVAQLQALSIAIEDLPAGQLATATSSSITLDLTAAGYGWFFDATPADDNEFDVPVPDQELQTTEYSAAHGRVDLLTVLMRQLGAALNQEKSNLRGPHSWLMESTLEPGTRRAPSFAKSEIGKVSTPKSGAATVARKSSTEKQASYQQVASSNAPRNSRGAVRRHHATVASRAVAPMTFADVMLNIGVLPAGKSITITFNATVDNPFPGPGAQVCNQGTVSGANFSNVLTDDPDLGGVADPTCTPIDLQADLEITAKTDTPDPVIAGNNITYTINFQNNGPNAAGATVTDATPAGTTFVSAQVTSGSGWTPTTPSVGGTGNVVFSKALVADDETATFEIVVKVNSSVAGGSTITNTATAATTGATDPVPGNDSKTAMTAVIAEADLSITKTDGVDTEIPGTSVTYTIVVSNAGPSDANGVTVADTFPATLESVTFTSVAAGGATGNTNGAGNINDTVNMPAGSSITYTVNATIDSAATGELANTATVTEPAGVTDPNQANNSATDTDTLVPTADLSITKDDGATEEVPGTSITYTIVVTNNGPSDANGVAVADTFPAILEGVTFTSVAVGGATGNTAAGSGDISDTLNMPAGSSVTYTVSATIDAAATGNLTNTATVTEPEGVTDPNQANNSATDTDTLTPQADLSITKTDGATDEVPGTSITYTIIVTNNGPSDAPGTSVTDTFPAVLQGVTYTSVAAGGATGNTTGPANGNINDTLSMPAGSSVTYTVNATIASSATGNLSNTATVTAGGGVTDPTPGNNSATDTDTLTPSADVAVDKTGPATITPGNNISYTITVTNTGPSDAVNLSLSDAIPAGTTFVSVTTPAGWTRTDATLAGAGPPATITFTAASFAAGAPASVFTLVVNANPGLADGTIITNTVTVGSATADPVPANNTDSVETTVQNNADLAITKMVAPTGPNGAGASVTYTVDVINNGPSPANNVTFTDVVPAGLVVNMQTNPSGWTCNSVVGGNGTITCTKSGMASGETAQLVVVATINCGQANGSTINNTATVSAASPADGNTANNTAMASFTVNNPAPIVMASVTVTQLPQNSHDLINVGLAASATDGPCGTPTVTVEVFGDEDDQTPTDKKEFHSPDAADIAVGTLRLRAERVNGGGGDGRVYLIVVKATDAAGQIGFATVTVVVPKNSSAASIASVNAQAAAAKAFADANMGAPPAGYFVIGDGPIIGPKQ